MTQALVSLSLLAKGLRSTLLLRHVKVAEWIVNHWLAKMLFLTINISARFFILLYCFRGEGDKDEEPFREAFANIGKLRSICPKATLLALTATSGPSQRRRIMKML